MAYDMVRAFLKPLETRLKNMVARAVVSLVDDSQRMQTLQIGVLADETRESVERVQNYGFTSVPHSDAEAVVLFVGGRRDHGLAVAVDDRRYRVSNLAAGEVAVYSSAGSSVILRADGSIEIAGNGHPVAFGDSLNTAIANLGSTIAGALTTMGASPATPMPGALAVTAGATVANAVTAFNTAAAAALSTKVKVG